MARSKYSKDERADSLARLRKYLQRDDTMHCVLRSRTPNGTYYFDVFKIAIAPDGPFLVRLTFHAAVVTGHTYDKRREALRVTGCGTDPGFEVVSGIATALFGDLYALKREWL